MNRNLFHHACRTDFVAFVQVAFPELHGGQQLNLEWHHRALCHALIDTMDGDLRRLIFNLPPRTLKSMISAVMFPAFLLGRDPSTRSWWSAMPRR